MSERLIGQRSFNEDISIQQDAEDKELHTSDEETNDTDSEETDADINVVFNGVESNDNEDFCMYCTKYERVRNIHDIKPGDSIRFPRFQGRYYHHAIVEKSAPVADRQDTYCSLALIHLQKRSPILKTGVIATTKEFDLNKEVIEKVIYKSTRFTPVEIVNRAKTYASRNKIPSPYHILACNCETLATKFAQNVKCSSQVIKAINKIRNFFRLILSHVNILIKIVSRLKCLPGISLAASALLLIDNFIQRLWLAAMLKSKKICAQCFHKRRNKLMIALSFGLISLGVSIITHINWPALVISLIASILLPFLAPIFNKYIMPFIQPSYHVPKQEINAKRIPRTGDILTFKYIGLPHEGIVSRLRGCDSDEMGFKVEIVHFPWPGIFESYTVTKEALYFTKTDEVYVLDFEGVDHFSADLVVQKALQEVGNQNHSHLTYRSSHMARECKTGKTTLKNVPKRKVQSYEDLSPGDIIRFKYCGLPHEAVVTQTAMAEKVTVDVIHYNFNGIFGTRQVVEETFTFDMKDKNTFLHDYTGVEVYEPDEVVRRAKSRLGEQKFNTFTNRASHLAKWCKVKSNPK